MKRYKPFKWLIGTKKALCGFIWISMGTTTYWNVGDYICTSMDTNHRIG